MSKLILVTVGTSALDKFRNQKGKKWEKPEALYKQLNEDEKNNRRDEYDAQKEYASQQLRSRLRRFYANKSRDFQSLTAELGSLMAMHQEKARIGEITDNDRIAFLYSDTAEGRLCAEINEAFVQLELCKNTVLYHLAGLRATPSDFQEDVARLFKNQGLKSLRRSIKQAVNDYRAQQGGGTTYINITGGYKVLAPFSTIWAHNLSMDVVYLYEQGNQIIWIPNGYLKSQIKNPDSDPSDGIEVGITNG
jgi:putative CRISPR-associated protein (TIGR02619 family)